MEMEEERTIEASDEGREREKTRVTERVRDIA